jgi:hypothetical protein
MSRGGARPRPRAKLALLVVSCILASGQVAQCGADGGISVFIDGAGNVTVTPGDVVCRPVLEAGGNRGECRVDTPEDAIYTLTADPVESFLRWEGDCTGEQPACSLDGGPLTDFTVTAVFDL